MNNFMNWNLLRTASVLLILASCAEIVEPITLPELQEGLTEQQDFEINVRALTFETAHALNAARYDRMVSKVGKSFSADSVPEASLRKPFLPRKSQNLPYMLGIGDKVALIQDIDPSQATASQVTSPEQDLSAASSSNIISTTGRIGTDGSLLLIGVGRLDANGRQISELRDEIRTILIRNGQAPNFQLEIQEFNSQKAYITTDEISRASAETAGNSVPITDQGVTLREVVASAGINFDESVLTIVRVKRKNTTYTVGLSDLLVKNSQAIYLQNQDHVFIQSFNYQPGKVFLLGGIKPQIIPITPEKRQTLADALFVANGPLATSGAKRSAIYLLRGRNPVQAYHLDAQNPLRMLVANDVELRPNDIVFVAEQSIITLNRTLSTIFPLRAFINSL